MVDHALRGRCTTAPDSTQRVVVCFPLPSLDARAKHFVLLGTGAVKITAKAALISFAYGNRPLIRRSLADTIAALPPELRESFERETVWIEARIDKQTLLDAILPDIRKEVLRILDRRLQSPRPLERSLS